VTFAERAARGDKDKMSKHKLFGAAFIFLISLMTCDRKVLQIQSSVNSVCLSTLNSVVSPSALLCYGLVFSLVLAPPCDGL
jgi:hypothetical protein